MSLDLVLSHYNYWVVIVLMMIGFYIVIVRGNLVKKIVGLNIFQTSVFLLYISMGKVEGGTAPILTAADMAAETVTGTYSNPLPSVLILTAIVVGVATTALGLALVVRIKEAYGTSEEDEILAMDEKDDLAQEDAMRAISEKVLAEERQQEGAH